MFAAKNLSSLSVLLSAQDQCYYFLQMDGWFVLIKHGWRDSRSARMRGGFET